MLFIYGGRTSISQRVSSRISLTAHVARPYLNNYYELYCTLLVAVPPTQANMKESK